MIANRLQPAVRHLLRHCKAPCRAETLPRHSAHCTQLQQANWYYAGWRCPCQCAACKHVICQGCMTVPQGASSSEEAVPPPRPPVVQGLEDQASEMRIRRARDQQPRTQKRTGSPVDHSEASCTAQCKLTKHALRAASVNARAAPAGPKLRTRGLSSSATGARRRPCSQESGTAESASCGESCKPEQASMGSSTLQRRAPRGWQVTSMGESCLQLSNVNRF